MSTDSESPPGNPVDIAHTTTYAGGDLRIGERKAVLAKALEVERDRLAHPLPRLLASGPRRDAAREVR